MTTHVFRPAGPVDVAVIAFEGEIPRDSLAQAVAEAVAGGSVSVLDVLVVRRDESGEVHVLDVDSGPESTELFGFDAVVPGLLGEEDATSIAAELQPGTGVVMVVWENVWAAGIAHAVREAGGVLVALERLPAEDIDAVVQEIEAREGAAS